MGHDGHRIERRYFPPVQEGYDRTAVDAYVRELAHEVDALTQASDALQGRLRALGGELRALTLSTRTDVGELPAASATREPVAVLTEGRLAIPADEPVPVAASSEQSPTAHADQPPAAAAAPVPATAPGNSDPRGAADLDSARLVALNMALEGQPREQTDHYLAERFQLSDRAKLLDEVYAAIEG